MQNSTTKQQRSKSITASTSSSSTTNARYHSLHIEVFYDESSIPALPYGDSRVDEPIFSPSSVSSSPSFLDEAGTTTRSTDIKTDDEENMMSQAHTCIFEDSFRCYHRNDHNEIFLLSSNSSNKDYDDYDYADGDGDINTSIVQIVEDNDGIGRHLEINIERCQRQRQKNEVIMEGLILHHQDETDTCCDSSYTDENDESDSVNNNNHEKIAHPTIGKMIRKKCQLLSCGTAILSFQKNFLQNIISQDRRMGTLQTRPAKLMMMSKPPRCNSTKGNNNDTITSKQYYQRMK